MKGEVDLFERQFEELYLKKKKSIKKNFKSTIKKRKINHL